MDVERLATYDFFADNPLLVFAPGTSERTAVLTAGFDSTTLSYHSASQRFSNRRARLEHDLAELLARGLIKHAQRKAGRLRADSRPAGFAAAFCPVYANAYGGARPLRAR